MPTALVVTSINPPNAILQALAHGAVASGLDFIVAGDTKSPPDFALDGCRFLNVEAQRASASPSPRGALSDTTRGRTSDISQRSRPVRR